MGRKEEAGKIQEREHEHIEDCGYLKVGAWKEQKRDPLEHEHIKVWGYLKVGTVGRKEERQEGEDGGTEKREVSSSRLKNAQNSLKCKMFRFPGTPQSKRDCPTGKRCCRNLNRNRDRVEFCVQRTADILEVVSEKVFTSLRL